MNQEVLEKFARGLFEHGAIKFGEFRLKLHETDPDAPLSPIYIDLRIIRSVPSLLKQAVLLVGKMLKELDSMPDLIADVPTAATPIVAVVAYNEIMPMITPRQPKTHGASSGIDGLYQPGQTVDVIDDLVTRADSKLEAIRVLEEKGLKVRNVLVLVDREQGGADQIRQAGYVFYAACTLSWLLSFYEREGLITHDRGIQIRDGLQAMEEYQTTYKTT